MKEAEGLGLYLKVGGRLHFVLFHKFICGNSWKKGVRHHDFYSELVLRGVGHGYFYFILAGLLPPLVAPHGDDGGNKKGLNADANTSHFHVFLWKKKDRLF